MKDLKAQLKTWEVEVALPPRFQSEVWRRIGARAPSRAGFFVELLDAIRLLLLRPGYSAALILAAVFTGLGAAHFAAGHVRDGAQRTMEAQYINTINPLAPRP